MAKNKDKAKAKSNDKAALAEALGKEPEVEVAAEVEAPKADKAPAEKAPEVVKEEVTDSKGRVLFRRVQGGSPLAEARKAREVLKPKARTRFQKTKIPGNPSTLAFPTDRWGVTKDLKRAFIDIASRIGGDARKMELTEEVLEILVQHLKDKYAVDKRQRDKRFAAAVEKDEARKAANKAAEAEAEAE